MSLKYTFGIILLGFIWSPAFLLIEIGSRDLPPITFTMLRSLIGVSPLVAYLFWRGRGFAEAKGYWLHACIAAFLNMVGGQVLCAYGQQYVSSSMAGVIEGSTPVFTLLISRYFLSMRLLWAQIVGIAVGLAGLLVVFLPTLINESVGDGYGCVLLIIMSIMFGAGFLYADLKLAPVEPLMACTIQLLGSLVFLVPLSMVVDAPWQLAMPGWDVWLALVILALIVTDLGWLLCFFLMKKVGAGYISISAMLFPVFAMGWGVACLEEQISLSQGLGAAIILLGLFFSSDLIRKKTLA